MNVKPSQKPQSIQQNEQMKQNNNVKPPLQKPQSIQQIDKKPVIKPPKPAPPQKITDSYSDQHMSATQPLQDTSGSEGDMEIIQNENNMIKQMGNMGHNMKMETNMQMRNKQCGIIMISNKCK